MTQAILSGSPLACFQVYQWHRALQEMEEISLMIQCLFRHFACAKWLFSSAAG